MKCIKNTAMGLLGLCAVVACVKCMLMGVLPIFLILLYAVVIIAVCACVIFGVKKKTASIVWIIVAAIFIGLHIYGITALFRLDKTLSSISSDTRLDVVEMAVIVKENGSIAQLSDLDDMRVGYVPSDELSLDFLEDVMVDEQVSFSLEEYDNVLLLVDALLDDSVDAIVMNEAFIDVIADQEGYENLGQSVKVIYSSSMEVESSNTQNQEEATQEAGAQEDVVKLSADENTFVAYISGIDMWGAVNARSRSDVNILAVVNVETGHIELINTPRDYYVYLPNQGAMDKLTHAGLYGIDSSIAALENLYGVEIDYYVRMNFSGFEAIIDALGGIDVYSAYDFTVDPIKHYTVGYNHVTGLEALAFARERYSFSAGDVQRGINQMEVIKAVINKMTSPSILANYGEVLKSVEGCVLTNMSSETIYDLVRNQIANGTEWTIDQTTVTGTGEKAYTYSMPSVECYVMKQDEQEIARARELIEAVLNEE